MKSDDERQDQQTLREEFDAPQSIHAEVYARLEQVLGKAIYRGRGVTRREYATELAALLREHPEWTHYFRTSVSLADALTQSR